jgi:hypothetical protein
MYKLGKFYVVALLLAAIMVVGNSAVTASAATGVQGYAIYRDGAIGGLDWHAGLMDEPASNYTLNTYQFYHLAAPPLF